MNHHSVASLLWFVFVAGCGSSDAVDAAGGASGGGGETPAEPEGGKPGTAGSTNEAGGSSAGGGSATVTPLGDHELFLVGVWRGTISVDDSTYSYFVLQSDRTGCGWDRHGTNFGQRFFAYEFSDWHLVEQPLDQDGRMTLRFTAKAGDVQSIERYDPKTDRIYVGGYQANSWLDLIIPCNSVGTNATETGVMRQGSSPN